MLPSTKQYDPSPLTHNSLNNSNNSQVLVPELNVVKAVVLGFVLGGLILFAVVGNILVILSVVCHRNLRTVTHYFIVNLAVADLLISSIVLPFSAILEILDRWVFGRVFCNIWAAVDVLCCTASIMSLCVISVDRYIGVSYPLRYPAMMTKRRALLAVLLLWVLSVIISIGPLFGWKEPAPEDETICKITEEPGESQGLREGQKTEKSHSEHVILRIHRGNATVSEDEALRSSKHFALRLLKFSREKKAAKTLGIVSAALCSAGFPSFWCFQLLQSDLLRRVVTALSQTGSMFPAYRPSDTVFKITFWLGYFNSCINPIIYPCSNQEFKKAFQSLLGCLKETPRPLHLSQSQGLQGRPNSLGLDNNRTPSRLSPSSSIALSRTPSSRDDSTDWRVFSGSPTSGTGRVEMKRTKVAKLCSKSIHQTCCCFFSDGAAQQNTNCSKNSVVTNLPTIKIHQLSLSEKGEAV
ncbi:hypothetical protein WMY93_005111 [Mugilogobius chulae]|uniref:G-protein coupled receptors family 1 profile domain-containing protein n=1 Tax=Mugilogobius chulae TaxID=88201 RepID=A0AAW0PWC4_9GOBI